MTTDIVTDLSSNGHSKYVFYQFDSCTHKSEEATKDTDVVMKDQKKDLVAEVEKTPEEIEALLLAGTVPCIW